MKKIFITLIIASFLFSCSENKKTKENNNTSSDTAIEKENLTPENVVKIFIEDLGAKNFEQAFEKSKVEAWGDFNKFSSTESFGGIVSTKINKIKSKPDENDHAVIYVEALYSDKVNGDNTFKQNFYLKQFGGEWKIVKMKIVKAGKISVSKATVEKEIQDFLLPKHKVLKYAIGDIDNDNIEDVILIQQQEEEEYSNILIHFLLRDSKKQLSVYKRNKSEGECRFLDIKGGKIEIEISYMNGVRGRFENTYTFSYNKKDKDWYLTHIKYYEFSIRPDYDKTEFKTTDDFGIISFENTKLE